MSIMARLLWLLVCFAFPMAAFAGEAGQKEEAPMWFPMLEMAGVVLGVVVSIVAVRIYLAMKGGMIGVGFGRILLGIVSITLGIATNGMNELVGLLSEFGAELTFELFIYAGLIFIGAGVMKVAEVAA